MNYLINYGVKQPRVWPQ